MDPITFDGQVAVVTGAGGGLGRAYALGLAARGAAVVVNDLPATPGGAPSAADAVVAEIEAAGGRAAPAYASVADRAGAHLVVDAALERFGRVDVVVNNAGVIRPAMFPDMTEAQYDLVMDLHVGGMFHVTQAAYPHMARAGYGRVVNTASGAGAFGMPAMANYGAAKGAVLGFTRALAHESAKDGVLVNVVLPNAMTTITEGQPIPGDTTSGAGSRSYKERLGDRFHPGSVSPLVLFLASRACTSNGEAYSALAGRFARLVTATTTGWTGDVVAGVEPEEVAAHLAEIDDRGALEYPTSVVDEYRLVAESFEQPTPAA